MMDLTYFTVCVEEIASTFYVFVAAWNSLWEVFIEFTSAKIWISSDF